MANKSSSSENFDEYDVVGDELSIWEFIDPSSSDDDEDLDNFSFSEEQLLDDVTSESKEDSSHDFGLPSSDISINSLSEQLQVRVDYVYGDDHGGGVVRDDDDDGDDGGYDYDDGYELDDELVPLEVSDKFGRQRIRKLGKRACPRMSKSKRLPYHYNRPGCVHGKHGFGVHSNI